MLKYQMPWSTVGTVDVYLASDADSAIREAEEKAYMLAMKDIERAKREAQEGQKLNDKMMYSVSIREAKRKAREQGAEEERQRIKIEYSDARQYHLADVAFQIATRAPGEQVEPVLKGCTCAYPTIRNHASWCECSTGKPPEPAPLEKVVLDGDGYCNDRTWAVKFNVLIDAVNRIEARGKT